MTKFTPSILIVTALEEEFEAAKILLYYRTKVSQDLIDTIISSEGDEYKGVFKCVFGQIPSSDGGWHEVLLSQISRMGNTPAAARTGILLQKFESIKYVFMVGIAGGIPNLSKPEDHVRLGDIVISESVIEYDNLKIESLRYNKLKPYSNNIIKTSEMLLKSARKLKSSQKTPWIECITYASEILGVIRPSKDILWVLTNNEKWKDFLDMAISDGLNNDQFENLLEEHYEELYDKISVEHPYEKRVKNKPKVFLGPVASANILLKDEKLRDELREKYGVKAVEMESAGVATVCKLKKKAFISIRGICDYCNWKKNDDWHDYAAIVAAAFAKLFFLSAGYILHL